MLPEIVIFGIHLKTFSIVCFLAVFACVWAYCRSKRYDKLYAWSLLHSMVPVLIFAAIGGRAVSALTLAVSSGRSFLYWLAYGGFVYYVGLLGGMLGLFLGCRTGKQSFLDQADVLATLLPLGHAIGRIGCFLNGCCYGKAYTGPLSIVYPVHGALVRVFPTWFVESAFCFALFCFFRYFCKTRKRGIRTAEYFIAYSVFRFFLEFLRGDEIRGVYGALSVSQIISILTLVFGAAIWIISEKKNEINYQFTKEYSNYAI